MAVPQPGKLKCYGYILRQSTNTQPGGKPFEKTTKTGASPDKSAEDESKTDTTTKDKSSDVKSDTKGGSKVTTGKNANTDNKNKNTDGTSGSDSKDKNTKGKIPNVKTVDSLKNKLSNGKAADSDSKGKLPNVKTKDSDKVKIDNAKTTETDGKGKTPNAKTEDSDTKGKIPYVKTKDSDIKGKMDNAKTAETEGKGKVNKMPKVKTKDFNKNKMQNSKTEESNAKNEESNAKTEELNAKTKEPDAKTKESNAKTEEPNNKTEESNDKSKGSNGKTGDSDNKSKVPRVKLVDSFAKFNENKNKKYEVKKLKSEKVDKEVKISEEENKTEQSNDADCVFTFDIGTINGTVNNDQMVESTETIGIFDDKTVQPEKKKDVPRVKLVGCFTKFVEEKKMNGDKKSETENVDQDAKAEDKENGNAKDQEPVGPDTADQMAESVDSIEPSNEDPESKRKVPRVKLVDSFSVFAEKIKAAEEAYVAEAKEKEKTEVLNGNAKGNESAVTDTADIMVVSVDGIEISNGTTEDPKVNLVDSSSEIIVKNQATEDKNSETESNDLDVSAKAENDELKTDMPSENTPDSEMKITTSSVKTGTTDNSSKNKLSIEIKPLEAANKNVDLVFSAETGDQRSKPNETSDATNKPNETSDATNNQNVPSDATNKPNELSDATINQNEPSDAAKKLNEPLDATNKPNEPSDATNNPNKTSDELNKPNEPFYATIQNTVDDTNTDKNTNEAAPFVLDISSESKVKEPSIDLSLESKVTQPSIVISSESKVMETSIDISSESKVMETSIDEQGPPPAPQTSEIPIIACNTCNQQIELEQIKSKLDRIEKERNDYKQQMDKFENRVVELTADLAEENTTATQASEMLETESAERMRLEKELKDVQGRYGALKRNHDKLEMEMTQVRLWQAETLDGEMEEDDVDGGIYKDRYEKLRKEMAFTRKKMQQQHEEEMDQEHISKKAVEKRLHETLDETEDLRRQLAAAKKKSQKLMSEMQDSKLHLEEQMSRNNDLERKQRRFDTELNKAHEEAKSEKNLKEKLQRERDTLSADKYSLEKDVERLKGDMESQESKYHRLQAELGDTLTSAGVKDDHEISALKRAKAELEAKTIDQEEELDDQAGQIQQLEQTKVRLEMNLEKQRQQSLKEVEEKDQEMEDLRYSTQKKLKQMEAQMEEEYEERKLQVQKNRELEQRLQDYQGQSAQRDKGIEKRIRKDLKKTKALLKDAEVVIQRQKTGEGSKMAVRQLRNQLDDAEFTSASAIKAKKTMELELADLQQQLDELFKSKQEIENKSMGLLRDKSETQSQLEENEEDLADIMKKYKAVVQQQTVDQITMNDQLAQIEDLIGERDKLKAEVSEMKTRLQTMEENTADKTVVTRLENKVRDLETRLDLETTNKHRLEVAMNRLKEQSDRLTEEKEHINTAKTHAEENIKKVQRQLRDLREEFSDVQKREIEMTHKYKDHGNKVAELEADFEQNQADLKLAFKRIADLQAALEDGLDSDDDLSDSDLEDDDSGSDIDTFLSRHKRSPLVGRRRSIDSDSRSRVTSSSSYLTDPPSSPRFTNNIDHSFRYRRSSRKSELSRSRSDA